MIKFHTETNSSKAQIICDPVVMTLLKRKFSVKNDAAKFAKKYGRNIPDKKHVIDKLGRFDFGMYKEIINFLRSEQFKNIEYSPEFISALKCGIQCEEIYDGFKYPHRDFQKEIITLCLKHGRGTVKSATGSGKSFCVASLVENFWRNRTSRKFKVLVIVPGTSLVSQLQKDFKEYEVNFSYCGWSGKSKLEDTDVVIVNTENLSSKFADNSWIKDVDLLIVDECHRCTPGGKLAKIVSKINTPNKFGFTGSLPKDQYDLWKIIGTFGPLLFEKTSKELRDENILTDVNVKFVKLNHDKADLPKKVKKKDKSPTEDYNNELFYIYNCEKRNNLIKKIVQKLNNNTLILVNHLEHGDKIVSVLSDIENKRIFYIKGEVEVTDRDSVIQEMENADNIVCVAMSSIFSTGINIKNLHNIVFVAGGKSFIRIVQGIGRGLRLHKNKEKLYIIDVYDNAQYSEDHADERKKIYDDESISWKEIEINL